MSPTFEESPNATWSTTLNCLWRITAGLAIVLFAMLRLWDVPNKPQHPIGCDSFGYQRQAALFRENGLAGIKTALSIPPSDILLEAARSSGFAADQWFEAVAPHCHHYVQVTDNVILQYPPGTGALLSLFPARAEVRGLIIASIALIAITFVGLVIRSQALLPLVPATLVALSILWVTSIDFGSESVYPAAALACIIGVLTVEMFRRRSLWIAALLGILTGLSAAVRLSIILLCLGPFVVLFLMLVWERRLIWLLLSATLAFGLAVGVVPVLLANAVNAGSVFATTYAPVDASLPTATIEQLVRAAAFYFRPGPASALLVLALAVGVVDLIRRTTNAAVGAAGITLVLSLIFFLTKNVLIVYYLIPTAAFYLSAAVTNWIIRTGSVSVNRLSVIGGMVLATLSLILVFTRFSYPGHRYQIDPEITAMLRRAPMVWANVFGGYFVTFNRVYAAKLNTASPEIQKELVAALAKNHIAQLIIAEDDEMKNVMARLSTDWVFSLLGKAYGLEVYVLVGPRLAARTNTQ